MLRCRNLTVRPEGDPSAAPILDHATAGFHPRAMNALIGPSGCGKTTLVKAILGLVPKDAGGEVWLENQRITQSEELIGRIGFAPQFSIAQPKLTVGECLRYALDLSVADRSVHATRLDHVLSVTGLAEHQHKRVESLSGGQLRRLGLGLELTVDPPTLICDEATTGLDPLSENQILDMMRALCRERGKTLICIIHNLAKLNCFDWITVVYAGAVVFQGNLAVLLDYFGISDALRLYDALNARPRAHWIERWALAQTAETQAAPAQATEPVPPENEAPPAPPPGVATQFSALLHRRARLFFRDHGYLSLVMAITFGFPVMVVIFALGGLPQLATLSLEPQGIDPAALQAKIDYTIDAAHTASLVTSLVMFQIILLTLMGANNGAREIAAERLLYEKERLTGLRPGAYTLAKLIFTGLLAALQGMWMTAFVKVICGFPGPWSVQLTMLALVCVSMTWVCLAFSAWLVSAEKASTLSIYLVGFQLPLSGVVLALPVSLVWVFRPFINAYWGWTGYFSSMASERIYDAYTYTYPAEKIQDYYLAGTVLLLHALIAAGAVWWGCRRRRWTA